jgi:hypothetical protein
MKLFYIEHEAWDALTSMFISVSAFRRIWRSGVRLKWKLICAVFWKSAYRLKIIGVDLIGVTGVGGCKIVTGEKIVITFALK